ncbi:HlyD family secretion protein [Pedobacter miscanthi]|uniref:HlyD family secretion protein n=1 Tax=Pedobacter miscanthi TaxID=2259170 RepID=UPI00292DFCAC|nr:HlyD family efflux transporter periplasmic adaptor subunit [Pedobacter miscanthi]
MLEENPFVREPRTEEVQHIIDRMPTRFGFWIGALIFSIFILILVFGFMIRYPDVSQGNITISTGLAPLKLVANTSGKIHILVKGSQVEVKENQLLGYIENPADLNAVVLIDSLLKAFDLAGEGASNLLRNIPAHISLGELNPKYYQFSASLQNYVNYKKDHLFIKQGESLSRLYQDQMRAIASSDLRLKNADSNLGYAYKFYSRDSTLFKKKVISESEFDRTEIAFIAAKDALQNANGALITARQSAEQTQSRMNDLHIQMPEKEKDLTLALMSSYNDLVDNIKTWEQKYVFKAPFAGKVQFLNFYSQRQFIQNGEEVFSVVPKQTEVFGQVLLPSKGAGKVKVGQEVIVKLEDFPYLEYGSVSGKVSSISLTSTTFKNDQNSVSAYLISISFPTGMVTNYDSRLDLKADSKGTAEIITKDRKLIERLFDNMRYRLRNRPNN